MSGSGFWLAGIYNAVNPLQGQKGFEGVGVVVELRNVKASFLKRKKKICIAKCYLTVSQYDLFDRLGESLE